MERDAIKSFEKLVTTFPKRSIEKSTKTLYDIVNVTFDVKKTDSLMNPVVGIINFTAKITTPYRPEASYWPMEMVFRWQGDHWKFVRLVKRRNGVDLSRPDQWEGAMSDFLGSLQ